MVVEVIAPEAARKHIGPWRDQIVESVPLSAPDEWVLTGEYAAIYVTWRYNEGTRMLAGRRLPMAAQKQLWSQLPPGEGVGKLTIKVEPDIPRLRMGLAITAEWAEPVQTLDRVLA